MGVHNLFPRIKCLIIVEINGHFVFFFLMGKYLIVTFFILLYKCILKVAEFGKFPDFHTYSESCVYPYLVILFGVILILKFPFSRVSLSKTTAV